MFMNEWMIMGGLFKLVLEDLLIGGSCRKTFCQDQSSSVVEHCHSTAAKVMGKLSSTYFSAASCSPVLKVLVWSQQQEL